MFLVLAVKIFIKLFKTEIMVVFINIILAFCVARPKKVLNLERLYTAVELFNEQFNMLRFTKLILQLKQPCSKIDKKMFFCIIADAG